MRNHAVGCPFALDAHAQHLTFAEVREEKISAILRRQRVLIAGERAGGRAAAEVVHHPKRVWPPRHEIVWVAVKAVVHHMREPPHPIVLVRVVVGEDFVLIVERDVEDVSSAGAIDFQFRAVRSQPEDAAAVQIDPVSVAAHRTIYTLVPHRDVKITIHGEPEIGGHMIVPIERPGIRLHRFDEIDAINADAVAVGEDAELWIVQHVEFSFEVLHSEHGVQVFGKNAAGAVGSETDDAAFLGVRVRHADVHRVLGHEDTSVRRGAHDRRMFERRRLRDEFDPPIGWRIGRIRPGRRKRRSRREEDGPILNPMDEMILPPNKTGGSAGLNAGLEKARGGKIAGGFFWLPHFPFHSRAGSSRRRSGAASSKVATR